MAKAKKKDPRRLSAKSSRKIAEMAALDFGPFVQASPGFLEPYDDDTFLKLGDETRTAILLLTASKSKMVAAAADRGEVAWFRMLESMHDAREILADLGRLLDMAYARGVVAAGVMSVKESLIAA